MDRNKRLRVPVRGAITRNCNEVDLELQKREPSHTELEVKATILDNLLIQIEDLNQKIIDGLLDGECTEEELNAEYDSAQEYVARIQTTKVLINNFLAPGESSRHSSDSYHSVRRESMKKTYKLPKIEIKKFDGDAKNWLGFWAQFKKIHEDEALDTSDKFQYLVQSMTDGTRAKSLVDSYPQSSENYEKVVSALTERFGDKVILTELYVREMLKLVVNNVCKTKTTVNLGEMYDQIESHLRSLESLGVTSDQSAAFLYPLVESSLPEEIIKVWQRSPNSGYGTGDPQTADARLKALMVFLKLEVKGAERLQFVKEGLNVSSAAAKSTTRFKKIQEKDVPTVAGLHIGQKASCIFCNKSHESKDCWKAQNMTLEEKRNVIQKSRACYLCFRTGHGSKTCRAFVKCSICGKKHQLVMCPDYVDMKQVKDKPAESSSSGNKQDVKTVNSSLACSSETLLQTMVVTVKTGTGGRRVRALLDNGSHRSYISENLVHELNLPRIRQEQIQHTLFGGLKTEVKSYDIIKVVLCHEDCEITFNAIGKDKICGEIPRVNKGPWMQVLKQHNIWVSDLGTGTPEIELLIGAKELARMITGKVIKLNPNLVAIETRVGWTVMGENPSKFESRNFAIMVANMHVADATVEQLWDLQTIGIRDEATTKTQAENDAVVKEHFLKTVNRTDQGRYSVCLPWMDDKYKIPSNFNVAKRRLEVSTNKLMTRNLFSKYDKILSDWLDEDFIEEVPPDQVRNPCHYLPHRAVVKLQSETTPVRPVFDASCKVGRNPSLNDCLQKGPNLLDQIPSILLRFREGKIGVISDIRKAFPMIEVNTGDRDYLRFLWWEEFEKKKLKILRHKRVVFGVTCSPYLLGAVIDHHLNNVEPSKREVAERLRKSMYVDNCVTSLDTVGELRYFKVEATEIMAEARMDLRLWQWSPGEESGVGELTSSSCGLETDRAAQSTSVLGLNWSLNNDTLGCDMKDVEEPTQVTKRIILSWAHKIFDPIGFLCPVVLTPIKLMQDTWSMKTGWDDEVNEDIALEFKKWLKDLPLLKQVRIPRNVTNNTSLRLKWQVHTFCDASQKAYAAVVFLRTENEDGVVSVQLMQAKSRVAPMKRVTIPRLELLSCVLAVRLTDSVKSALDLKVPVHYWSDSSTALSWIKGNDEWGTFVGNRVKEIVKLSDTSSWSHVPGIYNPADLPSRGCSPLQLLKSRWCEGPKWLKKTSEFWPAEEMEVDPDEVFKEKRKGAI